MITKFFTRTKLLAALGFSAMLVAAGSASAETCTATYDGTNPDATLTNSTACGPGTANNDTATEVGIAENAPGYNLTWTQLDRDNAGDPKATPPKPADPGNSILTTMGVLGANGGDTTGEWGIDATGSIYNTFLVVIKDGVTDGTTQWFWFIIDTQAGCSISSFQTGGSEFCGTWTMYGTANTDGSPGNLKSISHMTLYGATVPSGTTPGNATPEPGTATLALLGLGLVGTGFVARRRKAGR
jgi:PEP-CTERM motif